MTLKINDFYRGDTLQLMLNVKDSEGQRVNISSVTFWLTFKSNKTDSDANALLQIMYTFNPSPEDSIQGKVVLIVPASLTEVLPIGKVYWDIQFVTGSGSNKVVKTIGSNVVAVLQDITRTY